MKKPLSVLIMLLLFLTNFARADSLDDDKQVIVYASYDVAGAIERLATQWRRRERVDVVVKIRRANICENGLRDGSSHISIMSDRLWAPHARNISVRDLGTPAACVELGRFVVAFGVHPQSHIKKLAFEDICNLFTVRDGGNKTGGLQGIVVYGRRPNVSKSYEIINGLVLRKSGLQRRSVDEYKVSTTCEAAMESMLQDSQGIAYLQLDPQLKYAARLLPIQVNDKGEAISPTLENIHTGAYPLCQIVRIYTRPDLTHEATRFYEFLGSDDAVAVLENWRLYPEYSRQQHLSKMRVSDCRSGKGEKVAACGAVGGSNALAGRAVREMMGALAEEFVRAKAVVQVGYTPMATDVAGMGAFLATTGAGEAMRPRQELLLLDDRPSERAMQAHGERWAALGRDAAGQPDGTSPEEYLIAARGVAVIVNPSNKLNSLTLDQLRSVFSGELQDWSILAGGAGGGGAGKQEIKLFGLPQADVVTHIFANECLATDKWRRVTIRKSSDEVIKAVASDPAAIGIVDLATVGPVALAGLQSETAASAAGRSVKMLSIDLGRAAAGGAAGVGGAGGLRGAAAMPPIPPIPATADNLKNAMYPLSQRLYLYVHPLASDTAKDFAKFVATCGASEATPYADTVKSMIETYQKNGLIPLADEAINRMAKDALAAATKED